LSADLTPISARHSRYWSGDHAGVGETDAYCISPKLKSSRDIIHTSYSAYKSLA
jgi:hypothetical protein